MVENNVESVRENDRYPLFRGNYQSEKEDNPDCFNRICREQRTENYLASGVWRDDILFEDFRY